MKRVTVGISYERAQKLNADLKQQLDAADVRKHQGEDIDGMIELQVDCLTNSIPGEDVDLTFSNDDMERPEVAETVLIDVEDTGSY